jgi:hypothetical protein
MSSEHYTAHLKMERVTKSEPSTTFDRRIGAPAPSREVVEVLSLALRADTLEALQAKIRAHLEVS